MESPQKWPLENKITRNNIIVSKSSLEGSFIAPFRTLGRGCIIS